MLSEPERRHQESLAELYPDGNVPSYKAEGSDEYARSVLVQRDLLVVPGYPPAPFEVSDYRRADRPADSRTEAAARFAVDDATADHASHNACTHPFCVPCCARAEAWKLAAINGGEPDDFGLVVANEQALGSARRYLLRRLFPAPPVPAVEEDNTPSPFLTLRELRALPPVEMLVEEIVPQGSIGYITGRDGTYKTFLALDLAMHVVTMQGAWNGRQILWQGWGRVLFVAGEGARSFPKRIDAWLEHFDETLPPHLEGNLVIRNGAVDLYAGADAFRDLLAFARTFQPDLVVVDTLNRSAGGAEQNSASDMSVITARLAALKAAAGEGCTVVVVAHTTKADTDARGSSSIEDDADFVLHCKKDEDRLRLNVAKMKDGESGQDIELQALPVAESLVLVEARPEPEWLSDNLAARVVGVLFAVRDGDDPTVAQVLAMVKDDGKPAGKTKVYEVLGDLVREGKVTTERHGRGAAAPLRYRLDASQYPSDVKA